LSSQDDTLMADPRLVEAIRLFNAGEWYACHDGLEELWHETSGPSRAVLQGILQLAVAQLHLERGNRRGATILTGEGLGRLEQAPSQALGLNLDAVRSWARCWLQSLQRAQPDRPLPTLPAPRLVAAGAGQ
jgi:predicted metal-dependent hydrolase